MLEKNAVLNIQLPIGLAEQIQTIAKQNQQTISDIICLALASYTEHHLSDNLELEQALEVVHELSSGLGSSLPPHDGADNHDDYLYRL